MTADELLELATELAQRDVGKPRQSSLKRAISTAYYAVFHALAHECVDQTIGWSFRSEHYWQTVGPVYRSIDHAAAKRVFGAVLNEGTALPELKQVGRAFVDLQAERIRADYNPRPIYARRESLQIIEQARKAIETLRDLPQDAKRLLAIQLVTKQR